MSTPSLRSWLLVLGLGLASAGRAHAQELDDQTRSAARELATEGSALYEQGDFEGACDRFKRAYQLVQRPNVGIWEARSLVRAGHLVEASERYLEIERTTLPEGAPPDQAQAVQDAARERRELLGRLPSIKVLVEGADPGSVFVSLNGRLVKSALIGAKLPVDPGKLLVKGVRGEQTVAASIELGEGQFREVRLVFTPGATPSAPPGGAPDASGESATATPSRSSEPGLDRRLFGFIGIGVGGALLATGGIVGALAASDKSTLEQDCPERRCPPALHDKNDSYGVKKTFSSIGLISGAVIAGAGVLLVFTAPAATPTARAGVQVRGYVTASGAGLVGAF